MGTLAQHNLSCGAGGDVSIAGAVRDLRDMVRAGERMHDMVVQSPAMHDVVCRARKFAQTNANILITGENGTGKELVAKLVHLASERADGPFVRVNCAALPESLFESELFGHEAGAFTGASQRRVGRVEYAADGSLLLDEISEIAPHLQAKLLRVLEEMEYQRLGSNDSQPVRARVIATSNRTLLNEIAEGRFREDLYYRLCSLQLHTPPLRARVDDVPALVNHFLLKMAQERPSPRNISSAALKRLMAYDWPGNVRQLRNVVLHASVMCDADTIDVQDLPELPVMGESEGDFSRLRMDEIEQKVILNCLDRYGGNKTAVARHLGLTPRTIANKIKQYERAG